MSNKQIVSVDFKVNEGMVMEFARLTGDYNSMHVNPEVARKSKYRRIVVHGMIPYSFLQVLQHEFQEYIVSFVSCSARFRKPVFIGDEIHLEISYESNARVGSFEAVWTKINSAEVLIKSSGKFCLQENNKGQESELGSKSDVFITDSIDENQYLISDLSNQNESVGFLVSQASKQKYCDNILNVGMGRQLNMRLLCNNLVSILMLSTMVGMRLPGRYAIFTRFEFDFSENVVLDENYSLAANITKVSVPAETMEADVFIENTKVVGNGKLVVLLNPAPRKMISSQEILDKYQHLGLEDKVVLVTGASRGIGETSAKLFAALGAKIIINYN